jgi:DNA-binding transcriptional LysR family regulator
MGLGVGYIEARFEANQSAIPGLDVMLPASRMVDALKALRAEFPTVLLRLYVEALGAVTQKVLNRTAMIGISGPLELEVAGIERIGVGSVELIPVAAPDHPLALAGRAACPNRWCATISKEGGSSSSICLTSRAGSSID